MAVRVSNGAAVNFGTFAAETTVTHARVRVGTAILVTRALTTQRTIQANGQGQFDTGELDLVFPIGSDGFANAGLNALLALALDGSNALNVQLMTDDSTVVTTAGYSDQDVTNWTRANEAD